MTLLIYLSAGQLSNGHLDDSIRTLDEAFVTWKERHRDFSQVAQLLAVGQMFCMVAKNAGEMSKLVFVAKDCLALMKKDGVKTTPADLIKTLDRLAEALDELGERSKSIPVSVPKVSKTSICRFGNYVLLPSIVYIFPLLCALSQCLRSIWKKRWPSQGGPRIA